MKLLNIPDNIAKIFALAPKNLVLSMGKIFQFQIFTGFFKLHLFLALDALCNVCNYCIHESENDIKSPEFSCHVISLSIAFRFERNEVWTSIGIVVTCRHRHHP